MFLKALTLKGFKSFAEKTDLSFEPGVTVVVGPNGSGKSNLVDAIAWVLGAQGARALRGAKMDDVIFAGTTKKAALGRAEVSLTIDNSDGTLPIEFTEVTITRTLFRSGESEYRLNDVPCRLLDIQELLSDSRIGRTQHVIVGQGQLDSVLNARPEDRRAIIEEAAGVLKYRKRREKAQRRLESTEGNLTRLTDLVREVRRQLSPLQRQADAAKRHDGVRDELKSIQLFLAGQEIQGLQAKLERISSDRISFSEKEAQYLSELSELDMAVLEAEAALMKVGDSDVASWLTRAERLVAKTGATKSMLYERKRSINAQLDASADDSVVESLLAEKSELDSVIAELENSENVLVPTLASLRTDQEQFEARYAEFLASAPSGDVVRDYEALVKEQKLHEDNLAVLRDRLDADIARLSSINQRISVLVQDNSDANEVLETESRTLEALNKEYEILVKNLEGIRDQKQKLEDEHKIFQSKAAKSRAQYEVMLEAFETQASNSGIESVRDLSGVLGTLVESISIDESAIDAVSLALEDVLDSIVVRGSENAKQVANLISQTQSNASIYVLNNSSNSASSAAPEGTRPLVDFLKADDSELQLSLQNALSNKFLCEGDWEQACSIAVNNPDCVIFTKNGDRFGGNKTWSLGKRTASVVTAESIENAGRNADNLNRQMQESERELKSVSDEEINLENRERDLSSQINQVNSRYSIAKQTAKATESGITARRNEAELLDEEVEELKTLISNENDHIESLREKVSLLREQKENAELHKQEFESREKEHLLTKTTLENEIRRLEIEKERISTRLKDARLRLESVKVRLAKDPEQEKAAIERRNKLGRMISSVESLILRTEQVEASAIMARNVLNAEREKQTLAAHESTSKLETLRKQRRQSETNLVEVRAQMQKGEIEQAETKTRLSSSIETLRANFDCEPQVAIDSEMPEVGEGTTLSARARELERELKLMGPINPLAVQEYDELNERHVFLNKQLEDVKASRKELHKVIKTIDTEIVTVFEKAFEDVQKHFSDLFSTLFSGGAGRLTLTDPNDMLNTGIEMEARPSGKNVRRLSLLSGGERSLTALAFLFAVFRSRPSPFYVMDEVEAALDEPNLMRFLDLVAEFRHDAQLLIVSHQKKTMEAADELYGVTMAPGGSSRAIKQRIEKPETKEEDQSGETVIDLVAMEEEAVLESSI